jgi:K+ potassium transporter
MKTFEAELSLSSKSCTPSLEVCCNAAKGRMLDKKSRDLWKYEWPRIQQRTLARSQQSAGLSLSALGIVFGDIGTSPLYTLKTVLNLTGANPDAATTLGALSLILWTLFVVTTIKYVNFAMRIDNDGEGGIIALLALLGVKKQHRPAIVAAGLFGAALIYGDGTITPAISVLPALEGMEQIAPSLQPYVLPASVAVLFALFVVQPLGTAKIGRAFGPIMFVCACIAVLGVYGITRHPGVAAAINPLYGIKFLANGGMKNFLVLGGVFLCVTGAEDSMPIWAILGKYPYDGRGISSFFPASYRTTPARRPSCLRARRHKETFFISFVRRCCSHLWWCWPPLLPSSPANRSSPVPFP